MIAGASGIEPEAATVPSQSFRVRYVWPPVLIAIVLGTIAMFSVVAQEAWLAPSLASAVFSQMLHPDESGAEPVNIAVGQAIGIAAGFFGVWLAGATHAPSLTGDHHLVYSRVLAVVIAVVVASTLQLATGKRTPAGGATALSRGARDRDDHAWWCDSVLRSYGPLCCLRQIFPLHI